MGDGSFIPNSTQVHNVVLDVLLPFMREGERAVFLYLYRRTFGFNREEDSIGLDQFEHGIIASGGKRLDYGCGMKRRIIIDAIGFLIASGIIERVEGGVGRTHISRYRMKVKECPIVHTLEDMMNRNATPQEIAQILHQFRKVAKSAPKEYESSMKIESYSNGAYSAPLENNADSAPKEAKKGAANDSKKVQKSNPQSIRERQKETTPPTPSPGNVEVGQSSIVSTDEKLSPALKFASWYNTELVPLGAKPFNLDDLSPKLSARIAQALKVKSGKAFWTRVRDNVSASDWLRGKVKPEPGKKRFKIDLPWLFSAHYVKHIENYALIAQGEWDNREEISTDGHLEVQL